MKISEKQITETLPVLSDFDTDFFKDIEMKGRVQSVLSDIKLILHALFPPENTDHLLYKLKDEEKLKYLKRGVNNLQMIYDYLYVSCARKYQLYKELDDEKKRSRNMEDLIFEKQTT